MALYFLWGSSRVSIEPKFIKKFNYLLCPGVAVDIWLNTKWIPAEITAKVPPTRRDLAIRLYTIQINAELNFWGQQYKVGSRGKFELGGEVWDDVVPGPEECLQLSVRCLLYTSPSPRDA